MPWLVGKLPGKAKKVVEESFLESCLVKKSYRKFWDFGFLVDIYREDWYDPI
jgi:hypothetical protein